MNTKEFLPGQERRKGILDAILSSPSLFLMTLGALLMVITLIFRTGTWPALTFIFGVSVFIAGAIAQGLRIWSRRKST